VNPLSEETLMKHALVVLALSGAAAAANADGFTGPGDQPAPATAAEASSLPDDAKVLLSGFIVRSLGDEQYEFRDDTGTLVVEIDDDEWLGAEVTPEDSVDLLGEIDRDGQEATVELEVERVSLSQRR
jgi:uncharacterized protein (TIGR00156 family)